MAVYVCLMLTSLLWGSSFVFTRYLFLTEPRLTPVMVITLRLVLATLFLCPVVCGMGRWERIRKEDCIFFLLLALLEPFLYFLFENNGLRRVPGGLSSIIIATIPIFVPFGLYAALRRCCRQNILTRWWCMVTPIPPWREQWPPASCMCLWCTLRLACVPST